MTAAITYMVVISCEPAALVKEPTLRTRLEARNAAAGKRFPERGKRRRDIVLGKEGTSANYSRRCNIDRVILGEGRTGSGKVFGCWNIRRA